MNCWSLNRWSFRPIKDKQYSVLAFSDSAVFNLTDWEKGNFSVHISREDGERQGSATEFRQVLCILVLKQEQHFR